MVKIKGFNMPTKCSKCRFEDYDEEIENYSCCICYKNTEKVRETKRGTFCPLVEE